MRVRLQRRGWLLVAAVIALAVAGCSGPDPVSSWTPLPPPTVTPAPTPSSTLPPGWDPTWTENQMIAARMVGEFWSVMYGAINSPEDPGTNRALMDLLAEEEYDLSFNDIVSTRAMLVRSEGEVKTTRWSMGEEETVDGRQQIIVTTCVDRSELSFSNAETGEKMVPDNWRNTLEDDYTVAWVTEYLPEPGWRIVKRWGGRSC